MDLRTDFANGRASFRNLDETFFGTRWRVPKKGFVFCERQKPFAFPPILAAK